MEKDFQQWHRKKEEIDDLPSRLFFHERDIWFCYLGLNIGYEQNGRGKNFLRPVIILRKFGQDTFWAIPLTKAQRDSKKYPNLYCTFSFIAGIESSALLSQLRLLDAKRLRRKIGVTPIETFDEIRKRLKRLFP